MEAAKLARLIDAAQGRAPCDAVVRDVRYLDVFSCTWHQGDLAIQDGYIVGVEPGLAARRVLEGKGRAVVPGFCDAHVHVESSLLTPHHFQRAVLGRGTTSAICDPHELANVVGLPGIRYFLDASQDMALNLRVMLSSCVPATAFETNGGGTIDAAALSTLLDHPKTLGLAEMMNVPGVLHADPEVLAKLALFAGRRIDGHCPLVRGRDLSSYAAAGISSCHESSELEEAREKLGKGIAVWIREGSVAKDLRALAPLLTMATSTSIGFCTDDRNPLDIAREGHIDHLVRGAIGLGVPAEVAYRSASFSVARHYGLTRRGAIAPGYVADLILLDDANTCAISDVLVSGTPAGELDLDSSAARAAAENGAARETMRAKVPELADLEGPKGSVHVIGVREGRILTDRAVMAHDAEGVARLTVLERHGHGLKPANGYVRGFGRHLRGAIASSVGHDSHNLIVVGSNPSDMRAALAALIACGGGFCVVSQGSVRARLPLPIGGLMSPEDAGFVERALVDLHRASTDIGCELPEPFLQLAFLSLPVIPSLKLTDRGLMDVDAFRLIDVRAA
ncbi:adenine deaminase [Pendulispora albinea]|uniref:Adenine deaminase n=1 Tax=Pendulispora albinea TaxID=2741071 RepID=A0ABZ2M869_9BACT